MPRWQLVLLGVVGLLPAVIAVAQLGRIHPDEVYQVLEPAWHRVHGYGVLAWEWRDGLRNWAVPMVVAGVLWVADVLGITHPVAYRGMLAVLQAALHGWMLWAVYRFTERRVGHAAGVLAAFLVGLYGPVLAFAGRTLSESFSAAFLVVGLEALDRAESSKRSGLLGGLALGLSVVTRYGSAVFVLAALVWLVVTRRWSRLAWCCLAGGAVALGLGALDWATWGTPFHSFWAYARFNVFSDGAAKNFGSAPPEFYVPIFFSALPWWAGGAALLWVLGLKPRFAGVLLLLATVALVSAARFSGTMEGRILYMGLALGVFSLRWLRTGSLPLFCAGAYLLAVSATAHKEERFLYPALVLTLLAAAPPVAGFLVRQVRRVPRAALVVLALGSSVLPVRVFPPFDLRGDQIRGIVAATRGKDVRGLLIVNEGVWGAGGYFYIGKNIPWRTGIWPQEPSFRAALRNPIYNRAVTFNGHALDELQAAGFRVVGQVGRETILARD